MRPAISGCAARSSSRGSASPIPRNASGCGCARSRSIPAISTPCGSTGRYGNSAGSSARKGAACGSSRRAAAPTSGTSCVIWASEVPPQDRTKRPWAGWTECFPARTSHAASPTPTVSWRPCAAKDARRVKRLSSRIRPSASRPPAAAERAMSSSDSELFTNAG